MAENAAEPPEREGRPRPLPDSGFDKYVDRLRSMGDMQLRPPSAGPPLAVSVRSELFTAVLASAPPPKAVPQLLPVLPEVLPEMPSPPTRPVPLIAPTQPVVELSLFEPTIQPLPMEPPEPPAGALLVADELFAALDQAAVTRGTRRRDLRDVVPEPDGALSAFEVQGAAPIFGPAQPLRRYEPYEPELVDLASVFPDPPPETTRKKLPVKGFRKVTGHGGTAARRGRPRRVTATSWSGDSGLDDLRRFALPALTGLVVVAVAAAAVFVAIDRLKGGTGALRSGAPASAVAAASAAAPAASAAPAVVDVGPAKFGVFRGTSRSDVAGFERWAGRDVEVVVDFAPRATWAQIAAPTSVIQEWADSNHRLVLSTAMLPEEQKASIAAGARGGYDRYYRALARNLVAGGEKNAIIRLGWEFNLDSSIWSTGSPKAFITYWRRIVDAMRAVPGQNFQFDWNVNVGDTAYDGTRYYPGADYVDYVGVDVYDVSWEEDTYPYPPDCDAACRLPRQQQVWDRLYAGDGGLNFWSEFARSEGKPLSLPEWGLWQRVDNHGGNDDPYFITKMHAFIADRANNVAYQAYFEVSQTKARHSMMKDFPRAGRTYRKLFNSGS